MMKRFFQYILHHKLLAAAAIIVIFILFFIFRPKSQKPIETQTVRKMHLVQSVSVSGTIAAKNFAELSFLTGGKLVYLGAKKGDFVNQYQTIAVLDQRTVQKNLETTLLNYSEQRNSFDQTRDNNQNRTPEQALNDAMKRILQNNQYDLDKSIKSVELQTLAKEQSVLVSPIAGIVTRVDAVAPGVNVSATTAFTVVDPNSLVFNMDVDEADIGKVTTGQGVNVVLDPYANMTLRLSITDVDFVSHTTSTGGSAYTVSVKLPDNNNYKYRVGMNGNGEIVTAEKDHALTVPISSLFENDTIYVKKNNHFEKRKVVLGLQSDTQAEVIRGVSEGEQVIVQPSEVPKQTQFRIPIIGRFLRRS